MDVNPYESPRELGDDSPEPVWLSICDWDGLREQGIWVIGGCLLIGLILFLTISSDWVGGQFVLVIGELVGIAMVATAKIMSILRSYYRQ